MTALMVVVAAICILAGTWQIQRFEQSVHDNRALDRNAKAASIPLTTAVEPLVGSSPRPGRNAVEFRTVNAVGTYLPDTTFLSGKIINNTGGFYVLNPFRTSSGVLLVVRGFVAADANDKPGAVLPTPTGSVRITGRLAQASSSKTSDANPAVQAARLAQPVYAVQLNLLTKQPGAAGLTALPKPDLSNPAGGAYEAQHFAYIIQWYLFALLALITPFRLSRNEVREAQRRFLGVDAGEEELALPPAKVAAIGKGSGAELVVRADASLVVVDQDSLPEVQRAKRLADRYGRSITDGGAIPTGGRQVPWRRPSEAVGGLAERRVPDSSEVPHRSYDGYHGAYNDYLWKLGLDETPPATEEPEPGAQQSPPVVVDADIVDED
jgi:cytochrome oxidase assembly protein ShyY1